MHAFGVGFLTMAAVLLVAAIGWVVTLWWWQERFVFQPPPTPSPADRMGVRVEYPAEDGHPLFGYLVGEPAAEQKLVIAFHGNADLAIWLVPWARELHRRTGARVLLAEYRGYAGISGSPTYKTSQADARGAWSYARTALGVDARQCVLFGHSLGSAIAAELAISVAPASLVLQSPFTNIRAMASRMLFPAIVPVWRRISRFHFDPQADVARLSCPVYVAHGDRDRVIPAAMGRTVFAAANRQGLLFLCAQAGHNDLPYVGGDRYWSWLYHAVVQN